jgi:hypothetical protein
MLESYKGYKVGDRVTVKQQEEAYDTRRPITPGMIGTVKSFPPKVRMCKGPLKDGLPYFVYVEFDEVFGIHNNHVRGGINICNLQKVMEVLS